MAKKPAKVTFERLLKEGNALNALLDRGVVFDGIDGEFSANRKELVEFCEVLDAVKERIQAVEKEYVVTQMSELITPLIQQTGGDMELMKELLLNASKQVSKQDTVENDEQNEVQQTRY